MLEVKQLSIRVHEKSLLHQVSLQVREGEWFALVGQSGSGKSILSQAVGRLLPSNFTVEGQILFEGVDLQSLSDKEIQGYRGKRVSYIFQDYQSSFTPFRTIGQHLDEYQKAHGVTNAELRKKHAIEALLSVHLDESLYDRYPVQLSGGQLQRASIAMALLLSPDLLIADEVTTALDSISVHTVLTLLAKRQQETGCAILFITHDWRHVRRFADRIAIMKDGQIVESGGKHRILDHPQHEYTKQLIEAAPIFQSGLRSGLGEEQE